jgi:DUF4097 and DUF4098 domain-containing protein YvlB
MRRLISATLVATFAVPAAAFAQQPDFHWDRAVAAGKEVSIYNISGNIKVTASTTGKVEVVGVKHGDSRYFDRIRADVQETSTGVSICVLYDGADSSCDDRGGHNDRRGDRGWRDGYDVSMSLEVAVPTTLLVSASNVSGDVMVTGAHGTIDVASVSGDVRLEKLHADGVRANSVSGNVDVQVDEFTGKGDLVFRSVSGDVTLDAPRNFDADISMSTVSGDINSDFPLTLNGGRMRRRNLEARIGNGGRRFDVSTVSGDLRIRAAK